MRGLPPGARRPVEGQRARQRGIAGVGANRQGRLSAQERLRLQGRDLTDVDPERQVLHGDRGDRRGLPRLPGGRRPGLGPDPVLRDPVPRRSLPGPSHLLGHEGQRLVRPVGRADLRHRPEAHPQGSAVLGEPGVHLERGLQRLPWEPGGEELRPRHQHLPHHLERSGHQLRVVSRAGQPSRGGLDPRRHRGARRPQGGKPREAQGPPSRSPGRGLRQVSRSQERLRSRVPAGRSFSRLLSARGSAQQQGILLRRSEPDAQLQLHRAHPEPVLSEVDPHLYHLPRSPWVRVPCRSPRAPGDARPSLPPLPHRDESRPTRAHPPSRRQRRQSLRRLPHALPALGGSARRP